MPTSANGNYLRAPEPRPGIETLYQDGSRAVVWNQPGERYDLAADPLSPNDLEYGDVQQLRPGLTDPAAVVGVSLTHDFQPDRVIYHYIFINGGKTAILVSGEEASSDLEVSEIETEDVDGMIDSLSRDLVTIGRRTIGGA